jgi:hypothetical protein
MRPSLLLIAVMTAAPLAALATLSGCEDKKPAVTADDHGHEHGPNGEHIDETPGHGHGGSVIALGEQPIGPFTAKASRDEGQIVAGKDAPIDVTVTPAEGSAAKAIAVRFWIGTQDAKGSVKAKAEIEDPADPTRWHTHAEIPAEIPADAKLWVEIETDAGEQHVGSFDLKR